MVEQVTNQSQGGGSTPTLPLQSYGGYVENFWIKENRKRDLYLKNPEGGIVYIPKGWCDEFEQDPNEELEILTYASVGFGENGPVDNLYVSISSLDEMREVTEKEAREIHPTLFDVLARLNAGEDVVLG